MIYKLEYSQIARKKLRSLKKALTEEYGEHAAKEQLTKLTGAARLLERNPQTIGANKAGHTDTVCPVIFYMAIF